MAMYVSVLPLAGRTSNETGKDITVWEKYSAAHVVVDHPNVGGGFTVVVSGKDLYSGFKYPLLSSNIVASGHTVMKIGPDYAAAGNVAKDYIPYTMVVDVVGVSGTNFFSVGASII